MEFKEPIDFVKYVSNKFGTRVSGSKGEYQAGEFIYDEIKKFADKVEKEYYVSSPAAFLDFIWFTAGLYILGSIFYFYRFFLLSFIFILIGILIYIFQQNFLLEVVDIFFPKVQEFHILGKIFPKKDAKNLVILSAHYDSAYEFPLLGKYRKKGILFLNFTVIVAVLSLLLSAIRLFLNYFIIDYLEYFLLPLGSILILITALTLRSKDGVIGANDDLAAVASIIWAGKKISENRPENTEVWILAVAGEEHMRGTKRFVKNHEKELKDRHALVFNLETPSGDYFLITTGESMFMSKFSEKCVQILKESAQNAGAEYKVAKLSFVGSDSSNFSKKGIDASTVFGLSNKDNLPYPWHTKDDIPEKLKPEMIEKSLQILLNAVNIVDKKI